jgi:NAD(P)-dependent dehydrogenase (short-subunit alcohol dehydrogenase family)
LSSGENRASDGASADFARRVCLITGAGGALGSYFCSRYAERYDIAAVFRRNRPWVAAQDAELVDPLDTSHPPRENQHPVFAIQADLLERGASDRVVEMTLARFGRIDLVVNAAVSSYWAPMLGTSRLLDSALRQLQTNVLVPLDLAAAVARAFWQGREDENRLLRRNVVNVSSIAGLRMYPGSGQSIYAATKAALNVLSAHMAEEFGVLGVRVNATAANSFPALVSTERAADAIVTLDDGNETGTIVVVDAEADEVVRVPRATAGTGFGYEPA